MKYEKLLLLDFVLIGILWNYSTAVTVDTASHEGLATLSAVRIMGYIGSYKWYHGGYDQGCDHGSNHHDDGSGASDGGGYHHHHLGYKYKWGGRSGGRGKRAIRLSGCCGVTQVALNEDAMKEDS